MVAQHLWHPFADMSRVAGEELVLDRGEGAFVFDERGRRYLDASASLWYCNVGHGRAELADVAARQLRRLAAYHLFDRNATRPALELAERLAAIAPLEGAVSFFTSGGSEAVDTAGKIARRFWQLEGQPQRTIIIARSEAYHGMNAYGTSLAGIAANAEGWGTLIPDVVHVDHRDAGALARALERHGDRVAAFIGEPVLGAGGVHPPEPGYWAEVRRLCDEHDVLLIADEVITGFGRLGHWFASDRYDIRPDLVTAAKGITSGYLPLGVVLCGERVRSTLWAADAGVFRHGYTYSGHATACAVALANLDVIEDERLLGNVLALEPVLAAQLEGLLDSPLVDAVRSVGLMGAVELSAAACADVPDLADRVTAACRERGLLVRALLGRHLQISPPLVVDAADLATIAATIASALDDVAGTLDPAGALNAS